MKHTILDAIDPEMNALAEKMAMEILANSRKSARHEPVILAMTAALMSLDDLGYRLAPPGSVVMPAKRHAEIEGAFGDFDIAGPDEVVVPAEPTDKILQAMYAANDTVDAPLEDWFECLRRAYLAAMTAAAGGDDG